jgi:DNA polymerase V
MLLDLRPASQQHELDLEDDQQAGNRGGLMQAMDGVNLRHGPGALLLASAGQQGDSRNWSIKQEGRTLGYTTRWGELALARA